MYGCEEEQAKQLLEEEEEEEEEEEILFNDTDFLRYWPLNQSQKHDT
jgi:hypothetical protein